MIAGPGRNKADTGASPSAPPRFVRDETPFLKLPEGRALSGVMCVDVGPDGHIWVAHAHGLADRAPNLPKDRSKLLPEVVEFDADGAFIQAWGAPGEVPEIDGEPQWPEAIETIAVDPEGAVWVFGVRQTNDHAALRFSPDGKLLLRLGRFGATGSDTSHELLGTPTDIHLDVASREAFISDGYVNHRVISFNVDTGEFIRAWGAYGKPVPTAGVGRESFDLVHSLIRGPEGHLYVCDRKNNRVQVFDAIGRKDARFVREFHVAPGGEFDHGSVGEVAFSEDGEHLYAVDNSRSCIWIGSVKTGEMLRSFAETDDPLPILDMIHRIACDGEGNVLVARVAAGLERYLIQH